MQARDSTGKIPFQDLALPEITTRALTVKEKIDYIVTTGRLHSVIQGLKATTSQLYRNGFPRRSFENPSKADILTPDDLKRIYNSLKANTEKCCRCNQVFNVAQESMKPICGKTKDFHVFDSNRYLDREDFFQFQNSRYIAPWNWDLNGFLSEVRIPLDNSSQAVIMEICRKADPLREDENVLSIDCEMVYTTKGYHVGKVSVVNTRLEPVLETTVRPPGELLDPNTLFSGLTRDDVNRAHTTIDQVRRQLNISSETILVGHSLEYDSIGLKIIHDNIVDSSLVYLRNPNDIRTKQKLKTLALYKLNMIIQRSGSTGHDSKEDAIAAMKLIQLKAKELLLSRFGN